MARNWRTPVICAVVGALMLSAGLHFSAQMRPMESAEGPQRIVGPKEFGVQYPYDQVNPGQRSVLNIAKQSASVSDGRPEDLAQELASDQDSDAGDPEMIKHLRRHGVSHDLPAYDLDKFSQSELELTMHSVLDQTDTICRRKLRMGVLGDGGWEICDDADVRPRQPCVIYSFGINNEFSFDDYSAKTYGCHVYSFDPSMKQASHNRSDHVHFYKWGLAGKTEKRSNGWQMYTFSDIRKQLGHLNTRIEVVKMDIEHSEWGVLPEMFKSGEMKRIKQLLIEWHFGSIDLNRLKLIQRLSAEGWKVFYTHKNPACKRQLKGFPVLRTNCYELHYLKRP